MGYTENISKDPNILLSSQFNDMDHFLEHIKGQMDVDIVQLETGPLQTSSRLFMQDGVAIHRYGGQ